MYVNSAIEAVSHSAWRNSCLPQRWTPLAILPSVGYHTPVVRAPGRTIHASISPSKHMSPADPAKIEDNLRLLSETLNVMFALLEDENVPIAENLSDLDLAGLEALRASLNERYSGEPLDRGSMGCWLWAEWVHRAWIGMKSLLFALQ